MEKSDFRFSNKTLVLWWGLSIAFYLLLATIFEGLKQSNPFFAALWLLGFVLPIFLRVLQSGRDQEVANEDLPRATDGNPFKEGEIARTTGWDTRFDWIPARPHSPLKFRRGKSSLIGHCNFMHKVSSVMDQDFYILWELEVNKKGDVLEGKIPFHLIENLKFEYGGISRITYLVQVPEGYKRTTLVIEDLHFGLSLESTWERWEKIKATEESDFLSQKIRESLGYSLSPGRYLSDQDDDGNFPEIFT
jgi:hypothetical protein